MAASKRAIFPAGPRPARPQSAPPHTAALLRTGRERQPFNGNSSISQTFTAERNRTHADVLVPGRLHRQRPLRLGHGDPQGQHHQHDHYRPRRNMQQQRHVGAGDVSLTAGHFLHADPDRPRRQLFDATRPDLHALRRHLGQLKSQEASGQRAGRLPQAAARPRHSARLSPDAPLHSWNSAFLGSIVRFEPLCPTTLAPVPRRFLT